MTTATDPTSTTDPTGTPPKTRAAALASAFPEGYRQLGALDRLVADAAAAAGIDPKLLELVKVRASQLNGCSYCLDMHSGDALGLDESPRRLILVALWAETGLFTERERAALALTEAMTTLPEHRAVPDEIYDRAAELFTERQLGALVWAITMINTWNRFGVTARMTPPVRA